MRVPIDEIVGTEGRMTVFKRGEQKFRVPSTLANVEMRDHERVVVVPRWYYERVLLWHKRKRQLSH